METLRQFVFDKDVSIHYYAHIGNNVQEVKLYTNCSSVRGISLEHHSCRQYFYTDAQIRLQLDVWTCRDVPGLRNQLLGISNYRTPNKRSWDRPATIGPNLRIWWSTLVIDIFLVWLGCLYWSYLSRSWSTAAVQPHCNYNWAVLASCSRSAWQRDLEHTVNLTQHEWAPPAFRNFLCDSRKTVGG